MKPAPFEYHDPRTIDDAVGLLGRLENAKPLAGGQSLVPMLNMRYVLPDHIVDLNRVAGLDGIGLSDGELRIGAMTRQRTLERDGTLKQHAPIFIEALQHVGHMATRARGTFGGSLANLDPAAELPGLVALYDGTLEVASARGRRQIKATEWGVGFMMTALEPDELLVSAHLPLWREPHGYAFQEFSRRLGDFAIAGVGVLLAVDANSVIRRAAIAIVGTGVAPVRLTDAEKALIGAPSSPQTFIAAGEAARKIDALEDAHMTASYRQQVAATLTRRALAAAAERARGEK